ncbi:LIM domain-containing protein WLIM2b [Glycine soja]
MCVVGLVHLDQKARDMSFIGTQQKCKACGKTVYPVDQLSAYHKACFKCSHCEGTLKLSNYSSMESVLYCKPHNEQLFKETGSFKKNFQSPSKQADKTTPELTRSPSKAASMFSGTKKSVLHVAKLLIRWRSLSHILSGQAYHKSCFKCSHGGCPITPPNYAALEGVLYCKHHFSQLFKEKGSYNHLIKSASIKRPANCVP